MVYLIVGMLLTFCYCSQIYIEVSPKPIILSPIKEDYNRKIKRMRFYEALTHKEKKITKEGILLREGVIKINFFSSSPAHIYIHGMTYPRDSIYLEDIFICICSKKTWIIRNRVCGADSKFALKDEYFNFLQLSNQPQLILFTTSPTKDIYEIYLTVAIVNLSNYQHGDYKAKLIFTIIPQVN